MATRFDYETILDLESWTVLYPSAQGFQEKFYDLCKQELNKSEFPNIDIYVEEFKSGGIFFNQEKTEMLGVSFKKSQFKTLGIFFRGQQFGNVMYYSLLYTIDRGLWDSVKGRAVEERYANVRDKCKNWAQVEEFMSLFSLGSLTFFNVMSKLDPEFTKNKELHTLMSKKS
jgi:hypothetical protein